VPLEALAKSLSSEIAEPDQQIEPGADERHTETHDHDTDIVKKALDEIERHRHRLDSSQIADRIQMNPSRLQRTVSE
jgi:hypothetical protein